jgi:DNA-directed RNA polymerase specialized sigma24 family protein
MRALWQALHTSLMQSTETLSFQNHFESVRQSDDALRPFPDPSALLGHQHAVGGDHEEKNRLLAALVVAAQGTGSGHNTATTLLWLALWPGLDALYRRLLRHFVSSPEELVSEISDRLTTGIQRLDLDRVCRIAATLIRNIERDIRRSLSAAWAEGAQRSDMPDDDLLNSGTHRTCILGLPDGIDTDAATALLTKQLHAWIGDDAVLVVAVAVHGERQHEAATELGIAPETARKRYQRATRRLRIKIEEIL